MRFLTTVCILLSIAITPSAFSSDTVDPRGGLQLAAVGTDALIFEWRAPGDDSVYGQAALYDIRYSLYPITAANWSGAISVSDAPLPSLPGSIQRYFLVGLNPGTTYYVAIKTADEAGNWSALSNVASGTTDPVSGSFACEYKGKVPAMTVTGSPGTRFIARYTYRNLGTDTWSSSEADPNYVELVSCDSSGSVLPSWLYPGDRGGWFSDERVVTIRNGSTTSPNGLAHFTFMVAIPDTAAPDQQREAYFRLHHATGGLLEDWGHAYILVTVPGTSVKGDGPHVDGWSQTPTDSGAFLLHQNYPNPFNPVTVVAFTLPTASYVRLEVYNILGQIVSTLADGNFNAGEYQFQWNGTGLPTGVYLYRLQTDAATETRKMMLVK